MRPGPFIGGLWLVWAVSWFLAAFWRARSAKSAGFFAELPYRLVLIAGGVAFFIRAHGDESANRLWHIGWIGAWICVVVEAAGFALCWWARLHLGRLWSGPVTATAEHRVVDDGPYRVVRHPIYTGIYVAILATMAAKGTILGIAGAALIMIGLWLKARLEERFLREQLGAAYEDYARRVPMLVPFV